VFGPSRRAARRKARRSSGRRRSRSDASSQTGLSSDEPAPLPDRVIDPAGYRATHDIPGRDAGGAPDDEDRNRQENGR
jgi:hypothetical protein